MQGQDTQTISTNETERMTTITGYEAELIRLMAERLGKTPEEFVLSFFDARCIALASRGGVRRASLARRVSFYR